MTAAANGEVPEAVKLEEKNLTQRLENEELYTCQRCIDDHLESASGQWKSSFSMRHEEKRDTQAWRKDGKAALGNNSTEAAKSVRVTTRKDLVEVKSSPWRDIERKRLHLIGQRARLRIAPQRAGWLVQVITSLRILPRIEPPRLDSKPAHMGTHAHRVAAAGRESPVLGPNDSSAK